MATMLDELYEANDRERKLAEENEQLIIALKALFAVSTPRIAECGQSPWQIAKAAIEKHGKGE